MASDDVRNATITGVTFEEKEVMYSVVGGKALFEGDIMLGTVAPDDAEPGIGITGDRYRWPDATIPYEIHGSLTQAARDDVEQAMQHWRQRTKARFVLRNRSNARQYPNYVRFVDAPGCYSSAGMIGGGQNLGLNAACRVGAAIHEIGHAYGLWHEQSREDRDRYVQILWQNIEPGKEHNFRQHISDGDDIGPYDFRSIMHYRSDAFSVNGQPTIVPLGGQSIGQRKQLSNGDVAAFNALYGSASSTPFRCGRNWPDANNKCGRRCPGGTRRECPSGEDCYRDLKAC